MEHALLRARNAQSIKEISDLDKARLSDLSTFLSQELDPKDGSDVMSFAAFLACRSTEFKYSLDGDLRSLLQELPEFKSWLRTQKLSFKEKAERLISALNEYLGKFTSTFFPTAPAEEFEILNQLLCKLLSQTESALVS